MKQHTATSLQTQVQIDPKRHIPWNMPFGVDEYLPSASDALFKVL